MILSDSSLYDYMEFNVLNGRPLVGPASIDLTIGNEYLKLDYDYNHDYGAPGIISLDEEVKYQKIISDNFTLMPNEFVLATTQETIEIKNGYAGIVLGRSSIARTGLQVECAGFIDPGFRGQITLELYNQNRNHAIQIPQGKRICQLVIFECNDLSLNPYKGKYQNQSGVIGSKTQQDGKYGI